MLSAAPSSGMCFGALALSVIGVVQLARWWLREPEGAEHIRELDSDRGERKFLGLRVRSLTSSRRSLAS
jgi:hypothetical protein